MLVKNFGYFFSLFLLGVLLFICININIFTTKENALEEFYALPFDGSILIALKTSENSGNNCFSIIIRAVYYNSNSFPMVLNKLDTQLQTKNWTRNTSPTYVQPLPGQFRRVYEQGNRAFLSVSSIVTSHSFELETLPPHEDNLLDNDKDDGYFTINYYYHPLPPNECKG